MMARGVPLPQVFLERPLAHRTLHDIGHNITQGRAENSVSGAMAAINAGYGLEIDVQLSRDNVAMVFHDYDLLKLTARAGLVRDFTAAELMEIGLIGGEDKITRLDNFLAIICGHDGDLPPILIELKPQNKTLGAETPALAQAVAEAVADCPAPLALMSFNPHSIKHIARVLPDTPRGLVSDAFVPKNWAGVSETRCKELAQMSDYTPLGASFISHNVNDLDNPQIDKIRALGGAVLCWTVRSTAQEKTARLRADNITFEGFLPS